MAFASKKPDDGVTIHLLDSSQGHPVQTWRFTGKPSISIGRNADNDVVIADQHVSRVHAVVEIVESRWTLNSLGRHGTLVSDRLVAEYPLTHQTLFRLGPAGPMLRFDMAVCESRGSETIDSIQPDLLAALEVDELRKQREVEEITRDSLFQDLQLQARRAREAAGGKTGPP